ncbi:hypothetical protein [Myroides marinus]|nr:hypothetical protein [Myroides marinus]
MKRILLFMLALTFMSCQKEVSTPPTDWQLDGVRGKVKKMVVLTRVPDTDIVSQTISLYDSLGYKVSMESLDNELDTELLEFSTNGMIKYEKYNGKLRKVNGLDYEGKVISEATQKWSSPKELVSTTHYTENRAMSTVIKYVCDKEGNVISMQMIVKAGEVDQANVLTKWFYDESGYQNSFIQKDVLESKEDKFEISNETFDKFGNVEEQTTYTADRNVFNERRYSYEYYE